MAGSNNTSHGNRPWARWAISSARSTPGTPTLMPLEMASMKPIGLPSGLRNRLGFAAGWGRLAAVIAHQFLLARVPMQEKCRPRQCPTTGAPPSSSTIWTAMVASTALPPWRRISRPACAAMRDWPPPPYAYWRVRVLVFAGAGGGFGRRARELPAPGPFVARVRVVRPDAPRPECRNTRPNSVAPSAGGAWEL